MFNPIASAVETTKRLFAAPPNKKESKVQKIFNSTILAGPFFSISDYRKKEIQVSCLLVTYESSTDMELVVDGIHLEPTVFFLYNGCAFLKYSCTLKCLDDPRMVEYQICEKKLSFFLPSNHEELQWGCYLLQNAPEAWSLNKGDISYYWVDEENEKKPIGMLVMPASSEHLSAVFDLPALSGWQELTVFTSEMREQVERFLFCCFIHLCHSPEWEEITEETFIWRFWDHTFFLKALSKNEEKIDDSLKEHPVIIGINEVAREWAARFIYQAEDFPEVQLMQLSKTAILYYDDATDIEKISSLLKNDIKHLVVITDLGDISTLYWKFADRLSVSVVNFYEGALLVRMPGMPDVRSFDEKDVLAFDTEFDDEILIGEAAIVHCPNPLRVPARTESL
ncbi:MAG: hypothetical protein H7A37_05900 [Chlamydiales bacterium]|nr:hypothetical protein [Chlamydiales bacterium]